ncbi:MULTISPECIES: DUF1403 family protein [unclassified Mesorhizobium]|uniref:DUF1403 family protein n=1 Tax=unclassified Mesorhizobium TaxID=325217 RepID=UPI000BAECC15|nr:MULTISPECIES: DUF1403 family protein [unclassified Mesorhizobium]PBB22711.1 hypothetical protein CK232_31700 [Mesorhizobium sp. WSM4304]PBB71256.1 hypothetical protein CK227_33070 [Mesorhizobium sp. WSM4308]TRC73020.1 DUF1403 family protein [Mesorhizobium sp. WSM4315]
MIRLDPATAIASAPPAVPAWALANAGAPSDADATFNAGAALASLDGLARAQPSWAGAWRQRMALRCAAASMRLAGRSEDEAALRDAWYLRPAGADTGPAGAVLGAWRQLAMQPSVAAPDRLEKIVDQLGVHWDDAALAALSAEIEKLAASQRPAPFAAAALAARTVAMRHDAELFAWWLADLVLAKSLRWPRPLPLLMAQAFGPAFRREAGGKRIRPGEKGFERAVCVALVAAAADACRLAADVSRRAERLIAVAPKLRAKGAGDVIQGLLDDDAVSGSLTTKNLSRFAARRLFDRLQQLDAVRELSGRPSFRLFGL